jgi:hypothetical protein
MELKELRKKPHLSHSSINMYMECGLQYKFSKIDKLKPQFVAITWSMESPYIGYWRISIRND